jgi:hypothetical protein
MVTRVFSYLFASTLALPLNVSSQEFEPIRVAMIPLQVQGEAEYRLAQSLSQQLTCAVEDDIRVDVVADGNEQYRVTGYIFGDSHRQFVRLKLEDPTGGYLLWADDYDYVGTTVDMMAKGLITALVAVSQQSSPSELPNNAMQRSALVVTPFVRLPSGAPTARRR